MSDYLYEPDGKVHTRYSELVRCTPGQIQRVLDERNGRNRIETEETIFGTLRHEFWAEESRRTKRSPQCFGPFNFAASHVEKEFTTEMFREVVVHSRPDFVSIPDQAIIDFKTLSAKSLQEGIVKSNEYYLASKQLPFYSYQLSLHDIRVRNLFYLIEIWNSDRTKILGYHSIKKEVTLYQVSAIVPWIRQRVAMLKAALKESVDIK